MNDKELKKDRKKLRKKAIKLQNNSAGKLPMADAIRIAQKDTATK